MNLYLAGSLIGFATGTAISILLLVLTVRAAKLVIGQNSVRVIAHSGGTGKNGEQPCDCLSGD